MSEPTRRQKRFCEEYIKDLNGAKAARRAGYSEKAAKEQASFLLTKPNIKEYIQKVSDKFNSKQEITTERILQEIAEVAFLKESGFYHDSGGVKQLSELSDSQKAALSSYTVKRIKLDKDEYEEVPAFKAHDKMKALELLGKYQKLFTEKHEITDAGGGPVKTLNDFYGAKDE